MASESFNIFFELPLKTISRGYKYKLSLFLTIIEQWVKQNLKLMS